MSTQDDLPETFIKQIKDALGHLYDFSYLQRHPLAHACKPDSEHPGEMAGQRLRRELMTAIEALNPGSGVPFRAPHARAYNSLLLHYVEGMTVQEAAHEMGISRRQAHRDLKRGQESVAAMLWPRCSGSSTSPSESSAVQLSSVQMEMARLETQARPTDICELLRRARESVEPQAAQREVTIHIELPKEPVVLAVDPVVARQVLVNILSRAVGQSQAGTLTLDLDTDGQASLSARYTPAPEVIDTPSIDHVINQLVDRLGWRVSQKDTLEGTRTIVLQMIGRYPTILVIDDNEGLVQLLSDYLAGQACRVTAATSSREGLSLAEEMIPDVIILDVMMPDMDGWELLQRLRSHPKTAAVPVIICSVINNPELAQSLGASLFLPKPISRDEVLEALRQVDVV